jgi:hypothetical protein
MRREVRNGKFYVEYHDLYASNRGWESFCRGEAV